MCQVWWLMPVVLATGDLESWKIIVGGQPGEKSSTDPISTNESRTQWHLLSQLCRRHK
jgi:hypothetical protein